MLFPLVRRLAPGLDVKALGARAARADRRGARLRDRGPAPAAGRPRLPRPPARARPGRRHRAVDSPRARHRVRRGRGVRRRQAAREAERDRFGEIVYRFFWGLLANERLVAGDPHPGNYLLCPDGRVCFLDFGLMRRIDRGLPRGGARARPRGHREDAEAVHRLLAHLGYLPDPDASSPRGARADRHRRRVVLRARLPAARPRVRAGAHGGAGSPRSPHFDEMRRQTLPPQALLLRRMEGLLFSVLGELRAGADWGSWPASTSTAPRRPPRWALKTPPTTRARAA